MIDSREKAIQDKNFDKADNIKANIDYIKDVAINNLKKNKELIIEQNQNNNDIRIYENVNFDFRYDEDITDRFYNSSTNRLLSKSSVDNYRESRSITFKNDVKGKTDKNHLNLFENHENKLEGKDLNNDGDILNSNKNVEEDLKSFKNLRRNELSMENETFQKSYHHHSPLEKKEYNVEKDDVNDEYPKNRPDEDKLEPLQKSILVEYELSISIFSEYVIRSLFSLRFQYKEWAIKYITHQLQENYHEWLKNGVDENEKSNHKKKYNSEMTLVRQEKYIMASIQVLRHCVEDTREKIVSVSMNLLLLISCK
ncbi:hypothetical protein H8356DRAFT_1068474 [Neocallimastix lanati (nom. inval.)]|nr:hypothetical protein H8356DRAFT_1068474 [Neocallimastix sp. JGI-2020a]